MSGKNDDNSQACMFFEAFDKWLQEFQIDEKSEDLILESDSSDLSNGIAYRLSLESDFGNQFSPYYRGMHNYEVLEKSFEKLLDDHGYWFDFKIEAVLLIMFKGRPGISTNLV